MIEHYINSNGTAKRIKDRLAAALLALFTGWFGLHKFYTGRIGWGIIYLFFSWTTIPMFVSLVEACLYFFMTDEEFDLKYNA